MNQQSCQPFSQGFHDTDGCSYCLVNVNMIYIADSLTNFEPVLAFSNSKQLAPAIPKCVFTLAGSLPAGLLVVLLFYYYWQAYKL